MIINPINNTLPKVVLLVSLLLLCVIIVGGSTEKMSHIDIEKVVQDPIVQDSIVLNKLEKKINEYELTKKP